MAEQEEIFNDPLSPEIAKVADKFIEHMNERKRQKELSEIQERNLIGMMKRGGLSKIRHGGLVIIIDHKDESENLKIKEDKAVKTGKRHEVKKEKETAVTVEKGDGKPRKKTKRGSKRR